MIQRHLLRATTLTHSALVLSLSLAGGAADPAARLIARKLGENINQTIIVDNKAGAGGNIAHQLTANGPADGTLLLLGSIGPLTIAPHMMKLPYDPFKDLAPVSGGVSFPNLLVVHPGAGVKNMAEFAALARKAPDTVSYASTGNGSASHLAGELFASRIGTDMLHVPYKGGAPAMQDLLAGRFTGYFSAPPTSLPHVESGKLIPLATTGLTRPAYLPTIPTVAESGFPGFEALNWYAFVAPARTPAPTLDRWNAEIARVLSDPVVKDALTKLGLTANPTTRAELADFMQKESTKWAAVVKERKITSE